MGKFTAMAIILTMCNLFLYPVMYFEPAGISDSAKTQIEDDLGVFVQVNEDTVSFNGTSGQGAIPGSIDQNSIESGTGLSYVSGLTSVWDFLTLIAGFAFNIYFLMVKFGIPWIIALFVGLPTGMLQLFGMIAAIRGYDI